MICPNCGASNSTRATFCRRCHQRLPVAGLAAGVTYPRRRNVVSGGGRMPIIAALVLAASGIVVGGILVGLSRPGGAPGTFIALVTPSPLSSLPIFVQPTPTPTPPIVTSFPPLPTPFPPTIAPTDTPLLSPPPSDQPTPTPPQPTPTPIHTPRPTPSPTPTPIALTCASATGTATKQVFFGYGNPPKSRTIPTGWCVDNITIRIVTLPPGSTFGTARLLRNGNSFVEYTCAPPTPCGAQQDFPFAPPKLLKAGTVLTYDFTCTGDVSNPTACTDPGFNATIEIDYEIATAP